MIRSSITKILIIILLTTALAACIGQDLPLMENEDPSKTSPHWVTKTWLEGEKPPKTDSTTTAASTTATSTESTSKTKSSSWFSAFKLSSETPSSTGNLWDRLPTSFQINHYENSPQVQAQINWFLHHQDYLNRTIRRAAPYMYYIYQQVQRRNLPAELVLLPVIESAYNPFGYSNVGAAGLWQFMPQTATTWGIKRNWWYDGRRDIFASTNAALDYLTYLQTYFNGNWLLAIAAYNTGEGNVQAAIRRNVRLGRDTEFWSLPLSQQTQAYVPRLLALAAIIAEHKSYAVELPAVNDKPYLASIDVGSHIDLDFAAQLAGMNTKELYQLNPGYNHWATDPNGPYVLILPINKIDAFKVSLAKYPREQRVVLQHYKTRLGDTLAKIADRFEVDVSKIKKLNSLAFRRIKPGRTILIPITTLAVSKTISNHSNLTHLAQLSSSSSSDTTTQTEETTTTSESTEIGSNNETSARNEQTTTEQETKEGTNQFASLLGDKDNNAPSYSTESNTQLADNQAGDQTDLTKQSALLTQQIVRGDEEESLRRISQTTTQKLVHKVRPHEHLWAIAQAYQVDVKSLMKWNHLKSNYALKPGMKLVILQTSKTKVATVKNSKIKVTAANNTTVRVSKSKTTSVHLASTYKIKAGDTLQKIARKTGTNVVTLKRLNNLGEVKSLQPGQQLIVSES